MAMYDVVLDVIFVGLIAHVPLGLGAPIKHMALLLNATQHEQRLAVLDSTKIDYEDGFPELPEAQRKSVFDATTAQLKSVRVFDIEGEWLSVDDEVKTANSPSQDYEKLVPKLKKISGGQDLRQEIKKGQWHNAVAARFLSYSNERSTIGMFDELVYYNNPNETQCIAGAVKLTIHAEGSDVLTLRSGAKILQLKDKATILITNIPRKADEHAHFDKNGDILYGSIPNPTEKDKSCGQTMKRVALPTPSGPIRVLNTDVRCSNTNWP